MITVCNLSLFIGLQDSIVDFKGASDRSSERYIFDENSIFDCNGKYMEKTDCIFFPSLNNKNTVPLLKGIRSWNTYLFESTLITSVFHDCILIVCILIVYSVHTFTLSVWTLYTISILPRKKYALIILIPSPSGILGFATERPENA